MQLCFCVSGLLARLFTLRPVEWWVTMATNFKPGDSKSHPEVLGGICEYCSVAGNSWEHWNTLQVLFWQTPPRGASRVTCFRLTILPSSNMIFAGITCLRLYRRWFLAVDSNMLPLPHPCLLAPLPNPFFFLYHPSIQLSHISPSGVYHSQAEC